MMPLLLFLFLDLRQKKLFVFHASATVLIDNIS